MKTDNSGINIGQFSRFIENTFPIGNIISIRFIPKGEEGYGYLIETDGGNSYFAKAQKANQHLDFTSALSAVSCLHHKHKKPYVVTPIKTRIKKDFVIFDDYWISLFPYIQGKSLYEEGESETDTVLEHLAKIMADLHSINYRLFDHLPKETYQNPFEETIIKLIHVSEHHDFSSNSNKQRTVALLLRERRDIELTLEKMRTIQRLLTEIGFEQAITHGDANLANILRDSRNNLHLIDWGEIAIAPVERDLMFFIETDFKRFLSSYLLHRANTIIHPEIFEFYLYRWTLQEISDYGTRLLLQSNSEEVNEHSWRELEPYLPIPHESIKSTVNEIKSIC